MEDRLITIKEASQILGISEEKVSELVKKKIIPAYKVGGIYLRFKREQIEKLRDKFKEKDLNLKLSALDRKSKSPPYTQERSEYTFFERLKDFFYFYDFYILCSLIIILLLILIFTL